MLNGLHKFTHLFTYLLHQGRGVTTRWIPVDMPISLLPGVFRLMEKCKVCLTLKSFKMHRNKFSKGKFIFFQRRGNETLPDSIPVGRKTTPESPRLLLSRLSAT